MRVLLVGLAATATLFAGDDSSLEERWRQLAANRAKLAGFHQEFVVNQKDQTAHGVRDFQHPVVIDGAGDKWRERSFGGRVRIFDGADLFAMDEAGDEYVRAKSSSVEKGSLPSVYSLHLPDWKRAQVEDHACGVPEIKNQCIMFTIPLKAWMKATGPGNSSRMSMTGGSELVLADPGTGLVLANRIVQNYQTRDTSYAVQTTSSLTKMSWGKSPDAALLALPPGELREVKELSTWDAARIRKQLADKPAPELSVTDLRGRPVSLASLKGKTVLLDFWTTWCPPCRKDAPELDKLYQKYGDKNFIIVGLSVGEDRATVEKFLTDHHHEFPTVLTSENELPRPYEISVFPTYIFIDRDGSLVSAAQGDQGFGELRHSLRKAGLETE